MREYRQFYINGEWVDPVKPNSFDVINPANEEVCAYRHGQRGRRQLRGGRCQSRL